MKLLKLIKYTIITLLISFICGYIYKAIGGSTQSEDLLRFFNFSSIYNYIIFFIIVGVIAPFLEEFIFRSFAWNIILLVLKKESIAMLVTSFLFAIAHGSVEHAISVFPLGLFWGYLRMKNGHIKYGVICHMINNCLSFIYILL